MRKKTNFIIMGMVFILTLALVLTGCGKKNDSNADENYIVSANKIVLDGFGLDKLEGTVWASAPSEDAFNNRGRIDFLSDTELFLMVTDGQTGEYVFVEKDEYVYEDGKLMVDKNSAFTAIEYSNNSIIATFSNGYKLTFHYAMGEPLMPEDSINGYLEGFAYNHSSQNQGNPTNNNGLEDTVWLGTKSDVAFEYRLEVVSDTELYLLRMQNGNTLAIEKGTYSFDGSSLSINGIKMIKDVSYDENANRISITTANDNLIFSFRLTDEVVMNDATLSALIDSSGGGQNDNQGGNGTKPTKDSDGKYVYNVGGVEVHASVNIWDYIDGDTFDLYKMLRDNGLEPDFWKCKATVNGSEATVDGFPRYAHSSNGDYIFFNSPTQRNPSKAPKNGAGLAVMNGIGQNGSDVTFEPSANDVEESTYRVSGTEIGMSLDQAIVVAVLIDGTNNGASYDWYIDTFSSWQIKGKYFAIP